MSSTGESFLFLCRSSVNAENLVSHYRLCRLPHPAHVPVGDASQWATYFVHKPLLQGNSASPLGVEPLYIVQQSETQCCGTVADALVAERFAALVSVFDPGLLIIALLAAEPPANRKFNSLSSIISKHIDQQDVSRLLVTFAELQSVKTTLKTVCDFETVESTAYYKVNIPLLSSYLAAKVNKLAVDVQKQQLPVPDCMTTYRTGGASQHFDDMPATYDQAALVIACWQLLMSCISPTLKEEIAAHLNAEPWRFPKLAPDPDTVERKRALPQAAAPYVQPKRIAEVKKPPPKHMSTITSFFQKK